MARSLTLLLESFFPLLILVHVLLKHCNVDAEYGYHAFSHASFSILNKNCYYYDYCNYYMRIIIKSKRRIMQTLELFGGEFNMLEEWIFKGFVCTVERTLSANNVK